MTDVVYTDEALDDLERLTEFLLERFPEIARKTNDLIIRAVDVLRLHPEMGRPTSDGLRELVISRGRTGYLALYEFDERHDIAVVLRVRHQREQGYPTD